MDYTELYDHCTLCPRRCGVNRNRNERGFCGAGPGIMVAYAGLHNGEEPPISGATGSGTVFFSSCTMQCFFCQNYQLSREHLGKEITPQELAEIFLSLQRAGAVNINLVSGTHFTPGILSALEMARAAGLELPAVWNSAGFDTIANLERLLPLVKVYLPDLKTLDTGLSERIYGISAYPGHASTGLRFLARHLNTQYNADLMTEGIIMRHLVLPGETANTREVLSWFRDNLYPRVTLSLMFQYTPPGSWGKGDVPPAFQRPLRGEEYEEVYSFLEELAIDEGFIQELDSEDRTWSPDFRQANPFSSRFSRPVWSQGRYL